MITLTNGVQIPENAVQLRTTAAIDGYYVTQPLRLVQYDETLPVAAVQLTYQNQPYTPPTGAELNVRMGKPDGKGVYNPCLGVDSNGVVYFAFTLQMTIVAGYGTLTVEVTDNGVKNSAPIVVDIRRNPVPEGSIESADEFLTLQEILAETEKWGQIVQANASNIQQVVDNLEDIQNAAENAQAAAASAATAQQAAQEALGFRTFFSAVRPDANGNLDPSRPMTVGPAASVEIESKGDRIQSVTAFGFTTQAGSGDPSPSNVRQLTNGGVVLASYVLDGSPDEKYETGNNSSFIFRAFPGNTSDTLFQSGAYSNYLKAMSADALVNGGSNPGIAFSSVNRLLLRITGVTTQDALKAYLQANPLTVWYPTTDGTGSLYAPIILQGGEYRATCLPLTAPLCDGDSVVSWARSGCDVVVTYDGSEDEAWTLDVTPGSGPTDSKRMYIRLGVNVPNNSQSEAGVLLASYLRNTAPTNVLLGNASINTIAVQQSPNAETGTIYLRIDGISTVEVLRVYLAAHPLTVWYRSTNYTDAADIPVSLETHQQAVLVLDGTEGWTTAVAGAYYMFPSNSPKASAATSATSAVSDYLTAAPTNDIAAGTEGFGIGPSGSIAVRLPNGAAPSAYMPDKPLTVVYELATPITYAHEAVVLEAATGDQLTYTVTGQSGGTVSVALKPFQDGGHAKTADSAQMAINATNAQNAGAAQAATDSQQLGGLTLSALQNLLVPVGYIFSWAPVDDGPDLSTVKKVADYFGFGTWQAYGAGQVLVGVDSGQTEFATPGKTGGEKTHQLTTQELPSFTPSPSGGGNWLCVGGTVAEITQGIAQPGSAWVGTNIGAAGGQAIGGNQPHNNLQPYITVYRWQRVA